MNLPEVSINRPVTITMIILILMVLGVFVDHLLARVSADALAALAGGLIVGVVVLGLATLGTFLAVGLTRAKAATQSRRRDYTPRPTQYLPMPMMMQAPPQEQRRPVEVRREQAREFTVVGDA